MSARVVVGWFLFAAALGWVALLVVLAGAIADPGARWLPLAMAAAFVAIDASSLLLAAAAVVWGVRVVPPAPAPLEAIEATPARPLSFRPGRTWCKAAGGWVDCDRSGCAPGCFWLRGIAAW